MDINIGNELWDLNAMSTSCLNKFDALIFSTTLWRNEVIASLDMGCVIFTLLEQIFTVYMRTPWRDILLNKKLIGMCKWTFFSSLSHFNLLITFHDKIENFKTTSSYFANERKYIESLIIISVFIINVMAILPKDSHFIFIFYNFIVSIK